MAVSCRHLNSPVMRSQVGSSVQVQFCFAQIASHRAAKNFIAAFRAYIPGLFVSNPLFRSEFSPIGNRPQDYFPANGHGEIINVLTGKIIALVTTCITSFLGACHDITLPAMHEKIIG